MPCRTIPTCWSGFGRLRWQAGYGVLTLRKDELDKVSRYIDNQEAHHSQGRLSELLETFETEEDDWREGMING
jgi:hypothetical protein